MNRREALLSMLFGAGACAWTDRSALARSAWPQGESSSAAGFAGEWGGVLDHGGGYLRLKFVVTQTAGSWDATLVSLDQGELHVRADEVLVADGRLIARFLSIAGTLDVRQESADRLAGTWHQGLTRSLALERDPDYDALSPPPAEPLSAERLESLRSESGAPALAAAVRGARETRCWATGRRAADAETPVELGDRWHLGSITKSMTATLVARLVDARKLRWDMSIAELLGAHMPAIGASYREATFLHLLAHRSGLQPNLPTLAMMTFPREAEDARATRAEYAAQALAQEPVGAPAETFLYSNNGYVVAGAMLEAALGCSWEQAIGEHLFAPLGLSSAGFGPPGVPDALEAPVGHSPNPMGALGLERPIPHRPGAGNADNPAALGPAGRVHMSLADLVRYLAAHRDRSELLLPESWQRLHTPPFGGNYALGWVVRADGVLWHNGSNTIWYAEATFDRARGSAAAAAANLASNEASLAVAQALRSAGEACPS